jgi:UDP-N-acetylmuramate: L-alanyl-gamma-D-glutamyl-meso-diaminopimelate ligase
MSYDQKHIHIVGICGVATSAIAIAFKKTDWKVTGSDKGFFPPVSTELENHKIEFYAGWHPEKVGKPDIVMTGGSGTSPNNPEVVYARENNIPIYDYPQILEKYFIKNNSIVTVGTWGKTTTTSLLSYILLQAKMDPSYFTGGLSLSHDTGALGESDWSVVEGDEYQVSISDRRPKFVYYHPTHLLLTSVSWDHADLYPTEEAYFKVFYELVEKQKLIVACNDDAGVHKVLKDKKFISYGKTSESKYYYHDIKHTREGLEFSINDYKVKSPMLGSFNAENITGAFAMATEIGIDPKLTIKAIHDFKGIKRRFEKRFEGDVTVMDCHAPTAEKATSILSSLKEIYDKKVLAVYEPNIGGRQRSSAHMYDKAFTNADTVIIPHLSRLKVPEGDIELPMEGPELAQTIGKTHKNVVFIEDDAELVNMLKNTSKKGDVIVFLGSHGFRGMIEETVTSLHQ